MGMPGKDGAVDADGPETLNDLWDTKYDEATLDNMSSLPGTPQPSKKDFDPVVLAVESQLLGPSNMPDTGLSDELKEKLMAGFQTKSPMSQGSMSDAPMATPYKGIKRINPVLVLLGLLATIVGLSFVAGFFVGRLW